MAKASLRAAWAKKARGEPLTDAEEEAVRQYHKQANAASTRLYWDSAEQKEDLEKAAEKDGARNFSKWLVGHILRSIKASPLTKEEVERLRDEIDTANRRLDQEAENGAYFREKAKQFERERDEAQADVLKLTTELEELRSRMDTLVAKQKPGGGRK
ncbi:MAG: hypothetical protein ACYC2H_04550 [Thermoplasmatota archaeon]